MPGLRNVFGGGRLPDSNGSETYPSVSAGVGDDRRQYIWKPLDRFVHLYISQRICFVGFCVPTIRRLPRHRHKSRNRRIS